MASPSLLVAAIRAVIYALIIISGFIIVCPLGVSLVKHHNACLLSSKLNVNQQVTFSPISACGYNIGYGVLVCLLWPLATIICIASNKLGKLSCNPANKKYSLTLAITDVIALILALASACTVSVGLKTLCDSFKKNDILCPSAYVDPKHDEANRDYFYGSLKTAEVGAWLAFTLWFIQLISGLVMTIALKRTGRHFHIDPKSSQVYESLPMSP